MILALCGFMACGKTTLGRAVAERLGIPFVDLDEEITRRTGLAVSEILDKQGEASFRMSERDALCAVLYRERDAILALGGGTLLSPENRLLVHAKCRVIWLQTPEAQLLQWLEEEPRPLSRGRSAEEILAMLAAREPHYRETAHRTYVPWQNDFERDIHHLEEIYRAERAAFRPAISVYLGSHPGADVSFCENAFALGARLARAGYRLVYGGSNVGTMKALADGCLSEKGIAYGVFPRGFNGYPEDTWHRKGNLLREDLTEVFYVVDLPERKRLMETLSDACIALPGSWGTLDELFCYAANSKLRFNGGKPLFVFNLNGYYDPLFGQIARMQEGGFIDRNLITFCSTLEELFAALAAV
ncbi:MAG: TIGR00730 family Rossman fold protein [Bacteroidales bacterium]|nr:TIGR00730 family Rossman fold protein [Bacteroidales bacterium]